MKEEWIRALGAMTYGIYVLTSSHEDKINAMIASWVSQVSYDPLLIMVAVHTHRYSHQLIDQGGCLALHVLARNQADLLKRFKGSDPQAKFAALQWQRGKTGCPILADCIAYFEGRVVDRLRPGNHTLFIAEVVAAGLMGEGHPLSSFDYNGQYLGKK
jgi:flavin reductase (DIM6/NTAB) family NADH-FMN oxidoreductase RutF